jgi:hypothetical protein
MELYGVGYRMNDVYTFYRELDTSKGLNRRQRAYLEVACFSVPVLFKTVNIGSDGSVQCVKTMSIF